MLTPAGQEFLNHADRLLTRLAETTPVVHEIHTLKRGSVVIGASISAGTYVVPPLLGSFHERYPQVHVTLLVPHRNLIAEDPLTYKIDLVVMGVVDLQEDLVVVLVRTFCT